jgi:hypothetical protein
MLTLIFVSEVLRSTTALRLASAMEDSKKISPNGEKAIIKQS